MKIWIISSTPFLKDFEKISKYWNQKHECVVTPIVALEAAENSHRHFRDLYQKIKPNVIVTDHGLKSFFLVKIFHPRTKIIFFLRGNYWIERKNWISNQAEETRFRVKVELPVKKSLKIKDKAGNSCLYDTLKVKNNKKVFTFASVCPGSYTVSITSTSSQQDIDLNLTVDGWVGKDVFKVKESDSFANDDSNITVERRIYNIGSLRKIKRKIRKTFLSQTNGWDLTLRTVDKIVTVCDYLREAVKNNTGRNAITCPIGIDGDSAKNIRPIKLKRPAVCIIQNHQIKQKSEALINFTKVIKKLPEVNFYISKGLPENQNNKFYVNVIETMKKLKNVTLVDITPDNKYDYLAASDVYVLASGLDCTPATILEAELSGKPILASRIGGIPEMIQDGKIGWAIDNNNTKKWIEKIQFLVKNPEVAKEMGERAKKFVLKNYETEKISNNLLEIIES